MIINFAEQYRPKSIENMLLDDDTKNTFRKFIQNKDFPNLILYGHSGVGKTTLARMLTDQLDLEDMSLNASEFTGIDDVRDKISPFTKLQTFGSFRVVHLSEAEQLSNSAQKALKDIVESSYKTTRFIFTTNHISKLNKELTSRFTSLKIQPPDDPKQIGQYIYDLLSADGYSLEQPKLLLEYAKQFKPDIRRIWMELQSGLDVSTKKIGKNQKKILQEPFFDIVKIIRNYSNVSDIALYNEFRPLILDLNDREIDEFYTFLNNNMDSIAPKNKVVLAKILIHKFAVDHNIISDKEINCSTLLLELIKLLKS